MKYLNGLINGEFGKVVDGDDFDYDIDRVLIDGKVYEIGDEVGDIDSFIDENGVDLNSVVLYNSNGYRGEKCYSGSVKVNDKMYSLDIVSEYCVYELIEA